MKARKRKLPPVRQVRTRKGNHPSNPYAEGAAELPRLEDRHGYPFAARKAVISDEVPTEKGEPIYVLRASNPFAGMVLRFIVNASEALKVPLKERARIARIAAAMDAWRERDRGATP